MILRMIMIAKISQIENLIPNMKSHKHNGRRMSWNEFEERLVKIQNKSQIEVPKYLLQRFCKEGRSVYTFDYELFTCSVCNHKKLKGRTYSFKKKEISICKDCYDFFVRKSHSIWMVPQNVYSKR